MGRDSGQAPARVIDTGTAHIARVQDYWLGGQDHFPVDADAGRAGIAALPDMVASVRATRKFLGRSVRFLAGEAGIRQFLDIGCGIPAADNTHEVAQAAAPESRVVYVDNDPMVLAHARALLRGSRPGLCQYLDADLRDPGRILREAAEVLDFREPVAIVLMAVLQFIPDADDPHGIVSQLMAAVPAGSCLVISHPASDLQGAAMAAMAASLAPLMAQRVVPRSRQQVASFFSGLDMVEPGLVRAPEWRPRHPRDAAAPSVMWGGVGRKRVPAAS